MEVLDLIHHQGFFAANRLVSQPTTLEFFQPLSLQMSAHVAPAIHWALSEYTTGKKVTVMLSQDEYQSKFCPPTVIDCITAEAITHINYTLCGCFKPPQWWSSSIIGVPRSLSALLSLDRPFDISFSTPSCLVCLRSPSRIGAPQSPPWPWLGAPLFHSRLFTSHPIWRCSAWIGCAAGYALLNPRQHSLAWICAPPFHSALLDHHQHSPCRPPTPQQALLVFWRRNSFCPKFIILPVKLYYDSQWANLDSDFLDITNRAKPHWNLT